MNASDIFTLVAARFGDAAHDFVAGVDKDGPRDPSFVVRAAALPEVMLFLRDDTALQFDFLQNLTAVDWPKDARIQCVYHLYSYPHRHEVVVKVDVPREVPRVPSVATLWRSADWMEREQFDLLGVVFEGHPDLRRLLLPDDWIGHPMRKDYREATEYRGMPTTRPSPFDLLVQFDRNKGGSES